jgi:hypothetical protein
VVDQLAALATRCLSATTLLAALTEWGNEPLARADL